ncbi:MAG: branched-chain amino acid ABC transporter permease [Defluviitaleaceae bacterium]|nr:branched-chain amino acid ABC transporter permease [Defluviitaleaceae bacterium]
MKPDAKIYSINAGLVLAVFAIIFVLLRVGVLNPFYEHLIILTCINIILAVSLNLSAGFLGQLVLGHAAFMSVGAYAAAIFTNATNASGTLGLAAALIVGGLAAAVSGIVIGVPALRLRGDYIAIITLAFVFIVQSLMLNLNNIFETREGETGIIQSVARLLDVTGGAQGMTVPRLTSFELAFFVMVITVAVLICLVRSRHGRAMIAIREDEIAAEAAGISTVYYKILGFTISAFFAGVAGGLFAHQVFFIEPLDFDFVFSIELLVIVVLGGMGSFTGAIVAAIVLTLLPEMLREFQLWRMLVYAVLLIAMMIFRPKGLMGTYEFSVENILAKIRGRRSKREK